MGRAAEPAEDVVVPVLLGKERSNGNPGAGALNLSECSNRLEFFPVDHREPSGHS